MKKTVRVAAAVIRDGDRVYATRRGKGAMAGGWEFPGRKIEPGESPEEAAVREVREELRITICPTGSLPSVHWEYPDFILDMDCVLCRPVSGVPVLTEHTEARWLGPEELDSVGWLPADLGLIRFLKSFLSSGDPEK